MAGRLPSTSRAFRLLIDSRQYFHRSTEWVQRELLEVFEQMTHEDFPILSASAALEKS